MNDENGCVTIDEVEIIEPDLLVTNASAISETAAGLNDGAAQVDPSGGTPPYAYAWSTGATSDSINMLAPGDYSVTVTDANGCESIETVTVNAFGCILVGQINVFDVSCNGSDDGSLNVDFTGENGTVEILWSTGDTTTSVNNLAAGVYSVTLTDGAGCVVQLVDTVSQPAPVQFELNNPGFVCSGDTTLVQLTGEDISAVQWSDGQTGNEVLLTGGDYCISITDVFGCEVEECFTIVENPEISIVVDSVINASGGDDNGAIQVTVTGGTPAFEYVWERDGVLVSTDEDPSNLAPGTYTLVVGDAQGCTQEVTGIEVESSTSLRDITSDIKLLVYPNPAIDFIQFESQAEVYIEVIDIRSITGSLVDVNVDRRTNRISVRDLQPGVYFATIQTKLGLTVATFVKQ